MKKFFALLITFYLTTEAFTAPYLTRSFSFGGVNRQYLLYVPSSYDGSAAYPFVMALHGLGDNINNFKGINMNAVADTAHFILAIPQALVDNVITGSTAWNSGAGAFGVSLNAGVDDVGFLNALIDTVSANYNIDQTRVYSTGFSMGGFMSNRLACELNNRIAAIASVSGTIGGTLTCQPSRAVPVAHFHGTADATVNYTGNQFGNDAEVLVSFWVNQDNCDVTPVSIDTLTDIANDGKVVVHYKHINGSYNTRVEFFKVIGGAHEWLGPVGNDINYSVEIWRFFRDFKWEEQTSGLNNTTANEPTLSIYPNPAKGEFYLNSAQVPAPDTYVNIYNALGSLVITEKMNDTAQPVGIADLNAGIYLVEVKSGNKVYRQKIVIE